MVFSPIWCPSESKAWKFMPLGCWGRKTSGLQMMSTRGLLSSLRASMRATSVICPLPVAARLPYSVTVNEDAPGYRPLNISAAFFGPIVWLLDGPFPILKISFILSIAVLVLK